MFQRAAAVCLLLGTGQAYQPYRGCALESNESFVGEKHSATISTNVPGVTTTFQIFRENHAPKYQWNHDHFYMQAGFEITPSYHVNAFATYGGNYKKKSSFWIMKNPSFFSRPHTYEIQRGKELVWRIDGQEVRRIKAGWIQDYLHVLITIQ